VAAFLRESGRWSQAVSVGVGGDAAAADDDDDAADFEDLVAAGVDGFTLEVEADADADDDDLLVTTLLCLATCFHFLTRALALLETSAFELDFNFATEAPTRVSARTLTSIGHWSRWDKRSKICSWFSLLDCSIKDSLRFFTFLIVKEVAAEDVDDVDVDVDVEDDMMV